MRALEPYGPPPPFSSNQLNVGCKDTVDSASAHTSYKFSIESCPPPRHSKEAMRQVRTPLGSCLPGR